jgi:hypothetical protein
MGNEKEVMAKTASASAAKNSKTIGTAAMKIMKWHQYQ